MINCNDYTWQPARTKAVHGTDPRLPPEMKQRWESRIIRVRPIPLSEAWTDLEAYRRASGCDSIKFYMGHPEDCGTDIVTIFCEHEIFTD